MADDLGAPDSGTLARTYPTALRPRALGMLAAQVAGVVGNALAPVFLRADNRAVTGTYPYRVSG